ncbi:unnamed protein product [Prorocentrum cordatum]|uniref:Uncharacterized protein n=1 Tax=Prorocentrum cordatum TaxID=2364126 RepID=A0ABN9TNV5_9DINO|nr:unnamed protein product [Polarella glacialis]
MDEEEEEEEEEAPPNWRRSGAREGLSPPRKPRPPSAGPRPRARAQPSGLPERQAAPPPPPPTPSSASGTWGPSASHQSPAGLDRAPARGEAVAASRCTSSRGCDTGSGPGKRVTRGARFLVSRARTLEHQSEIATTNQT